MHELSGFRVLADMIWRVPSRDDHAVKVWRVNIAIRLLTLNRITMLALVNRVCFSSYDYGLVPSFETDS